MAEVVAVEPLGGLITLRNKPTQSNLPAVADTGRCSESSFDEARLQRVVESGGGGSMLLRSIYFMLHIRLLG